jgi:hypothetical protein
MMHSVIRTLGLPIAWATTVACADGDSSASADGNPQAPAPHLDARISAPWVVREQDDAHLVLQLGSSPDGVRVDRTGAIPGVTLIDRGRTLRLDDGGRTWPLLAPAFPEPHAAEVFIDGPDLVIRFRGPPLSQLTDHPEAPADPAIAWIRIRPRARDWRIATEGLLTLSLPNSNRRFSTTEQTSFAVNSNWGHFDVDADAVAVEQFFSAERWSYSTAPSLDRQRPYERLAFTWTRP